MVQPLVLVILVTAVFLAAVLNLAAESRFRSAIMGVAIVSAVCVGAFFYGSGYAYCFGLSPTSLMRALLALCRMFGGVNDLGTIQSAPVLQSQLGTSLFWFGHFCAFYVTASAAIATLGERLLRRIRVTLLRKGPLLLIYGVNPSSVAYGKGMAAGKGRSVLYIDPDGSSAHDSAIKAFGGVIARDPGALHPDKTFLRRINMRPGSRLLELAALHTESTKNLAYARDLLDVMTAAGIRPNQCRLTASGIGEAGSSLLAADGPGYGSVLAFDDYELTARLILKDLPPCGRLTFDDQGRAESSFRAVILGYGRMGRAILAHLVMNAQFAGSEFRADVFDPGPQNGFLHEHEMMKHYDIRFHPVDGRSDDFYTFLTENRDSISCLVICTGVPAENHEIASDIIGWFGRLGRQPLIIEAVRGSYSALDEQRQRTECRNIYDSRLLDIDRIDAMAMQINYMYTGDRWASPEEAWDHCGYFDRLSSRASADYYPALLRASGRTEEDVLGGNWPPDSKMLENLGIAEHKRWCAFHYTKDFSPLTGEAFERRAARWLAEKEAGGQVPFSLTKDLTLRTHACLVPWEELDALSARVSEITGTEVDYKQTDRNNVIALSDVLRALRSS